jgi:hypothetical protein
MVDTETVVGGSLAAVGMTAVAAQFAQSQAAFNVGVNSNVLAVGGIALTVLGAGIMSMKLSKK